MAISRKWTDNSRDVPVKETLLKNVPIIYQTYATMMKLGAVIPFMKKIHKIYQSHDIPHELC